MPTVAVVELSADNCSLGKLSNINVLVGRNGSGKSRFFRSLDAGLSSKSEFHVRYLSPERGGVLKREGDLDSTMQSNKDWLSSIRRKNQAANFKPVSAYRLRDIEVMYLRRLQDTPSIRQDTTRNFRTEQLDKINRLLTNISIEVAGADFAFKDYSGNLIGVDQISSGESEAVSLVIEILHFFGALDCTKFNLLLIDEPDVHLHPDLQARFGRFLINEIDLLEPAVRSHTAICIATHSTPLVCALSRSEYTTIGTKHFANDSVILTPATDHLKKVAPFFGHPLSLSLSDDAIVILEGEDDERVWQQAARTAQGRIRLFPVLATSVDQQGALENFCSSFLSALYDSPVAYSLRDGDGIADDLANVGPVRRFRLKCYAIENTLLTDECLAIMNASWPKFTEAATNWLAENSGHCDASVVKELIESADRLRNKKIKSIRQLVCTILGCSKPWEVVVGQALGKLNLNAEGLDSYSLVEFVGKEAVHTLLGASTSTPA